MTFFFVYICFMCISSFFFFNDTATTEIYTLSLHDALPIYDILFVGRELQSAGGLSRLQGKRLAWVLYALLLLLFALCHPLAHHLQEFLLFLLEVFLAVAAAHFGGG